MVHYLLFLNFRSYTSHPMKNRFLVTHAWPLLNDGMAWFPLGLMNLERRGCIFQSGNFAKTGQVREFYPKYWKNKKIKNTGKVREIWQLVNYILRIHKMHHIFPRRKGQARKCGYHQGRNLKEKKVSCRFGLCAFWLLVSFRDALFPQTFQ